MEVGEKCRVGTIKDLDSPKEKHMEVGIFFNVFANFNNLSTILRNTCHLEVYLG